MSTETNSNRGLLMTICILLAAILATNIWSIAKDMMEMSQAELRAEEVESIRTMLDLQSLRAQTLLSSYEDAAYGNSSIERITEQQLLAAEAQISGLEAIAAQNQMIAKLLLLPYTEPEARD